MNGGFSQQARMDAVVDEESRGLPRRKVPTWIKREAARQWDQIPDTPEEIRAWSKGAPINHGDAS